tara:strand:- start:2756 stop:2929 length:174 start_codon:yes stop_codon:yes gene_type:complete
MRAVQGIFRVNKAQKKSTLSYGIPMQDWEKSNQNPLVCARLANPDDHQKEHNHSNKE